jgi:NPCBM/NEW2 domain
MSVTIDPEGLMESGPVVEQLNFQRKLPTEVPTNLGVGEVSLVDIICGSEPAEFRIAGAIDPLTGEWGKRPWTQPKGVALKAGEGRFVRVPWNTMVDGIFVPSTAQGAIPIDSQGNSIVLEGGSGATWGPVWARRRINIDLDPFSHSSEQDDDGFWGVGTVAAMLDRLRWARDGLVGIHANVGLTIDLDAVRRQRSGKVRRLRGVVTLLERSHVSQPFKPKSRADFRVYVGGQERYQRLEFSREDGDAQFGATIEDSDRFLTLLVTDGGDGNLFDRVILIDPVLELSLE